MSGDAALSDNATGPVDCSVPLLPVGRPSKKPRTGLAADTSPSSELKPCNLQHMPFELLAEILMYTSSPKDILSVARCSKYFCATLVNNQIAVFIWRRVRATCKPWALPDPTPNFTEASYAAFLFDSGKCEVCEVVTNRMYTSFALRLRLCTKPECRSKMLMQLIKPDMSDARAVIQQWMPRMESDKCLFPTAHGGTSWPSTSHMYRRAKWALAVQEYKDAASSPATMKEYDDKYKLSIERHQLMMSFAVILSDWKFDQQEMCRSTKNKNEAIAKDIARKERWEYQDLISAKSYSDLQRSRNAILEEVTQAEYDLIRPQVEAEIIRNLERRKRRKEEAVYRERRDDVETHYNRLRSASGEQKNNSDDIILPTLSEFRRLPVINVLQSKTSPSSTRLSEELKKSPLLGDLIRGDLKKWREAARCGLGGILGFPDWKSASAKTLHPVDRVTARFRCKKCDEMAKKDEEDGCLDFKGACGHKCPCLDKKQRSKEVWSVDQFVKDDKAIAAAEKMIVLCGANAEERKSFDAVQKLGKVMCMSCDAAIIMAAQNIIGHAGRHENMQMSVVSEEHAAAVTIYPLEAGLCAKIMGSNQKAKKLRDATAYGCRHCLQLRNPSGTTAPESLSSDLQPAEPVTEAEKSVETEERIEADQAVEVVDSGEGGDDKTKPMTKTDTQASKAKDDKKGKNPKNPKLFAFKGLRSHMKTKHGIRTLRDEDIFCDWNEVKIREKTAEVEEGVKI